jgi:hypothetical protein
VRKLLKKDRLLGEGVIKKLAFLMPKL